MSLHVESWATQQLAEFVAALSTLEDAAAADGAAIERAAEALEAEIGAVVRGDRVTTTIGFPAGAVPHEALLAGAGGGGRCARGPRPRRVRAPARAARRRSARVPAGRATGRALRA